MMKINIILCGFFYINAHIQYIYVYITFRYFNYVSIFQQSTSNDKSGTWFPPSRPQSPAGRDETTERIIKENG